MNFYHDCSKNIPQVYVGSELVLTAIENPFSGFVNKRGPQELYGDARATAVINPKFYNVGC